MKQIIVNVSDLTIEEKQRVNEALAKITGTHKLPVIHPAAVWFFAPASTGSMMITWGQESLIEEPTHTPQQVLEMAGMAKQGHVHADLMALYAEDAKTTDKPWELWQIKDVSGEWRDLTCNPSFAPHLGYRRKPKTKLIHGVEIPDIGIDLSLIKERTSFYAPCTNNSELFIALSHHKHNDRSGLSTLGLTYPYTEAGKQAAILHAKAWLGIA